MTAFSNFRLRIFIGVKVCGICRFSLLYLDCVAGVTLLNGNKVDCPDDSVLGSMVVDLNVLGLIPRSSEEVCLINCRI